MKCLFLLVFTPVFINCDAQVVMTNGLIKAKIETHTENGGVASAINTVDVNFYLKDSLSKVVENLSSIKSVRILDERKGVKTVLIEKPDGGKTGFTFTFADKALEKRIKDSLANASRQIDEQEGTGKVVLKMGENSVKNILYLDESKTVNNFICKKAIVTTVDSEGQESEIAVWYINDYTFSAAFIEANAMLSFKGFNGLPVYYETVKSINYGGNEISIIRVYQILEIKKNLKIETKEFDIPEGYVIKTYAEWIKDNPSGLLK